MAVLLPAAPPEQAGIAVKVPASTTLKNALRMGKDNS
jgi:hypothetical protein